VYLDDYNLATVTTVRVGYCNRAWRRRDCIVDLPPIVKELSDFHDGARSQKLARNTLLVSTPLLFAFAVIVAVNIAEVI
jgi:hypothetical protein